VLARLIASLGRMSTLSKARAQLKRWPASQIAESDLMAFVMDVAKVTGWARAHFRPARTEHGWRTAVQGDGAGFPDCVLVRRERMVIAELKRQDGRPTADQVVWLDRFREVPGIEVYVWRPADMDRIVEVLR
jgi:hypothetical protein